MLTAPPDVKVRHLEAVLDDEPLLSEQLLSLAEWMAQYYLAPLGEVLRGMLPLMAEVRRTVYYRHHGPGTGCAGAAHGRRCGHSKRRSAGTKRAGSGRSAKLSPEEQDMERRVLERLSRRAGEGFNAANGDGCIAAAAGGLVRKKWIARETLAVERDARRMERFCVLVPDVRLPTLTQKQQAILAELAACGGELPLAELRARGCLRRRCKRWFGADWCALTSGRGVSAGRDAAGRCADSTERTADRGAGDIVSALGGVSGHSCCMG